ncbi:serpin B6-like [Schistocerca nitens]|uniref:serpin B6-like n=1 Tax=Schistocerca nitens TaxID=7011 RepID=UPI0021174C1C|nr:serpin B6-like [Schistocerca nitens]
MGRTGSSAVLFALAWCAVAANSIYFPQQSEAEEATEQVRAVADPLALEAEPPTNGTQPGQAIQFSEEDGQPDVFVPAASLWLSQLDNIIARGVLQFAVDLDRTLWAAGGGRGAASGAGAVFSPLSVVGALALVLLGAGGRTHTEVATLLGLTTGVDLSGARADLFHEHFGRQLSRLVARPGVDTSTEVALASAIFLQRDFPLLRQFVAYAREVYRSEVLNLDFRLQPTLAQKAINDWVENKTRCKIRDFLPFPPLPETRIIIGSAIYFNGAWQVPFPLTHSMKRPFYVTGGYKGVVTPQDEVLEVTLMTNAADLPYATDSSLGCSILGLPYRGGEAVMYLVLPDKMGYQALRELEDRLDAPTLEHLIASTNTTPVILAVPRMSLEASTSLKDHLETMGVKTLFDQHAANLSGLSPGIRVQVENPDADNQTSADETFTVGPGLYVDDVLHKVQVEVTETGTVAAAATALSITRDGSRPVFRADHPFLFFIHHRATRLVMFWGRVIRPTPHTVRQVPQPADAAANS